MPEGPEGRGQRLPPDRRHPRKEASGAKAVDKPHREGGPGLPDRRAQDSRRGSRAGVPGAGGRHTPPPSLAPQSPIPASPVRACSPDWEPSPPWTLVSISGSSFLPRLLCPLTRVLLYLPPRGPPIVFMLGQVPAPCKRPAPTCSCPHGQREGLAQAGLRLNPKPPEEPGCRTAGPDLWVALTSPGKQPASGRRKLPQG